MRILINLFLIFIATFSYAQGIPPTGIQDEGGAVSRPVYQINCVGDLISCSKSGSTGTITSNNPTLSSSQKAALITDETGTGQVVFNNSPTMTSVVVKTKLTVQDASSNEIWTAQVGGMKLTGDAEMTGALKLSSSTLNCSGNANGGVLTTDSFGNVKCTDDDTGGSAAPNDATYVTLSSNGTLTGERIFTNGTGITSTDGGANSTLTVSRTPLSSTNEFSLITDETGTGVLVGNNAPTMTSVIVGTKLTVNDSVGNEVMTAQAAGIKVTGGARITQLNCTGNANGGAVTADASGNLICTDDDTGGSAAPNDALYVTLSTNATLTNERVLTSGTGITSTDAGAGSTITLARSAISSSTEAGLITDETGTGQVVLNTTPIMTDVTVRNTFVMEKTDGTDILTAQSAGVKISGGAQITALNCTSKASGGVVTTDASGNLVCDDDDTGAGFAPVSSSYLVIGTDGTLTAERALTAGTGISTTDGGANTTLTVARSSLSSSSELSLITDESGTGQIMANTSPTMTSPTVNTSFTFTSMMTGTTGGVAITAPLSIPNGTNPLVDSAGKMAIDTTYGQLLIWSTPTVHVIAPQKTRCAVIENVVSTDDNFPMGSFQNPATINSVWCTCAGTCTTKATFTLADGAGNGLTIAGTNPVCTAIGTIPNPAAVSGSAASLAERTSLKFSVTNTPSPTTDKYELCVGYEDTRQ